MAWDAPLSPREHLSPTLCPWGLLSLHLLLCWQQCPWGSAPFLFVTSLLSASRMETRQKAFNHDPNPP